MMNRFSTHGVAAQAEAQEKGEQVKLVLGSNLSPKIVPFMRGSASIRKLGELDVSLSHHESNSADFTYDLSEVPMVLDPGYLQLTTKHLEQPKHICDGSNSHIYKALFQGKKVIIKVLKDAAASNEVAINEFNRELQLLSRFQCPNVLGLFGSGHRRCGDGVNTVPFLVLERLDGGTLTAKLMQNKKAFGRPFSYAVFLSYCQQLIDALAYIHYGFHPECTIIHRDLKPDNVGFTETGQLKLLDFGLSICVKRRTLERNTYQMTGAYRCHHCYDVT
jgi:serine/threonine protein kinase